MRVHSAIALIVAAFLLPAPSVAASFDCNKATTKLEAFICLDNELSAMDAEVAKKYHAVRDGNETDSIKKTEILQAQRAFLQYRTRVCPIPTNGDEKAGPSAGGILACLKGHYQSRLNELNEQLQNRQIPVIAPAVVETSVKTTILTKSMVPQNQNNLENINDFAPQLDGTWKIIGVEFGAVSAIGDKEAKPYIGKTLELYKGTLTSPFGNCEACGLARTYTKESAKKLAEDDPKGYGYLKFPNANAYVHELTWGESDNITVVQIDANTAYVPLEGAYFLLKHTGMGIEAAAKTPAADSSQSATPNNVSIWGKAKEFLTSGAMLYIFLLMIALAFAAIAWTVAATAWAWLGRLRRKIKARPKPVKPEVVLDAKTEVKLAEPEVMLNVTPEVKLSTKSDIQLDAASANNQFKNEEKVSVNSPANGLLGKNFGLAILGLLAFVFLYCKSESIWMSMLAISLVIYAANFTKIKDSEFIKGIPGWLEDPKSMAIAFVSASVLFVVLATLVSDYNKAHSTDEGVVVNFEEAKARSAAEEASAIKKMAEDKKIKFIVECREISGKIDFWTIIAYDSKRVILYRKLKNYSDYKDFYEGTLDENDLALSINNPKVLNKDSSSLSASLLRHLKLDRTSLSLLTEKLLISEASLKGELNFNARARYDYNNYNCTNVPEEQYARVEYNFFEALRRLAEQKMLEENNEAKELENAVKSRKM